MGGGMARNLLDAGYPVSVCDLDAKKVATLVDRGAASSPSPRETVANNDVTLFSQPTSGTFITVAEAEDGRLAGADDSKIVAATAYGAATPTKGLWLQWSVVMTIPLSGFFRSSRPLATMWYTSVHPGPGNSGKPSIRSRWRSRCCLPGSDAHRFQRRARSREDLAGAVHRRRAQQREVRTDSKESRRLIWSRQRL